MKSVDTNILYYATNRRCREHPRALQLISGLAETPNDWVIADQVLLEYYRLVRNSSVLDHPLSGSEAAIRLRYFREEVGCLHCGCHRGPESLGVELALWVVAQD